MVKTENKLFHEIVDVFSREMSDFVELKNGNEYETESESVLLKPVVFNDNQQSYLNLDDSNSQNHVLFVFDTRAVELRNMKDGSVTIRLMSYDIHRNTAIAISNNIMLYQEFTDLERLADITGRLLTEMPDDDDWLKTEGYIYVDAWSALAHLDNAHDMHDLDWDGNSYPVWAEHKIWNIKKLNRFNYIEYDECSEDFTCQIHRTTHCCGETELTRIKDGTQYYYDWSSRSWEKLYKETEESKLNIASKILGCLFAALMIICCINIF